MSRPTLYGVYLAIRQANTRNGGYSFEVAATKVHDRGRIPFNQTVRDDPS